MKPPLDDDAADETCSDNSTSSNITPPIATIASSSSVSSQKNKSRLIANKKKKKSVKLSTITHAILKFKSLLKNKKIKNNQLNNNNPKPSSINQITPSPLTHTSPSQLTDFQTLPIISESKPRSLKLFFNPAHRQKNYSDDEISPPPPSVFTHKPTLSFTKSNKKNTVSLPLDTSLTNTISPYIDQHLEPIVPLIYQESPFFPDTLPSTFQIPSHWRISIPPRIVKSVSRASAGAVPPLFNCHACFPFPPDLILTSDTIPSTPTPSTNSTTILLSHRHHFSTASDSHQQQQLSNSRSFINYFQRSDQAAPLHTIDSTNIALFDNVTLSSSMSAPLSIEKCSEMCPITTTLKMFMQYNYPPPTPSETKTSAGHFRTSSWQGSTAQNPLTIHPNNGSEHAKNAGRRHSITHATLDMAPYFNAQEAGNYHYFPPPYQQSIPATSGGAFVPKFTSQSWKKLFIRLNNAQENNSTQIEEIAPASLMVLRHVLSEDKLSVTSSVLKDVDDLGDALEEKHWWKRYGAQLQKAKRNTALYAAFTDYNSDDEEEEKKKIASKITAVSAAATSSSSSFISRCLSDWCASSPKRSTEEGVQKAVLEEGTKDVVVAVKSASSSVLLVNNHFWGGRRDTEQELRAFWRRRLDELERSLVAGRGEDGDGGGGSKVKRTQVISLDLA